jgi:hypothetical protein
MQQSLREKLADELRALDRKLEAKRGPGATVRRPRAVRRADTPRREDIAWLQDSLQQAVGKRFAAEVSRPTWGPRAQVDIGDDRALRYVFLMPGDDLADDGSPVATELRIHAGDTLSQARRFYTQLDDRRRRDLVELGQRRGWSVRPDFHFGFRARGFLHDHALVDVFDYIEYWREHIGEQRERPAGEWPRMLRGLADQGVVSPWYPRQFQEEIGARTPVHPRPGVLISHAWRSSTARRLYRSGQFGPAVRRALSRALLTIGEQPFEG